MTELDKIKESYAQGHLDSLKYQLQQFIQNNKNEILRFKAQEEIHWEKELDVETALKLFILHVRSINMQAEMKDQLKAIKEEGNYRSESHNSMNQVCFDWIQYQAPIWRGYRVLSIIYVLNQNRDFYLSLFN
ncbi:MAG TPA: hypothetical protein VKY57_02600 [Chitinispirillaceae bacterium]|nr:hypothetical protein [Chitinispirillaceae bacterium]